jgi:hypothetical protein
VCRDLVEEDIDGGRSQPLPELSDEEWDLLLSAPAFQMSTSMHYTVKVRRRRTSSRGASSLSGASRSNQGSIHREGQQDPEALGSSDESSDESEDDSATCSVEGDSQTVECPEVCLQVSHLWHTNSC